MNHHRLRTYLLLAFGCAALAVLGFLGAASAAGGPAPRAAGPALQGIPARPMPAGASAASARLVTTAPVEVAELSALHTPMSSSPDNGTVGSPGTWLSLAPDVLSPITGIAALMASGFAPSENVTYYANGVSFASGTSDQWGFTRNVVTGFPGEGYSVITAVGATSGKSASAAVYVQNNAPQVPGLAVAPHAVTSGSLVETFGVGYPGSSVVTFAQDGTVLDTIGTSGGRVAYTFAVTAATGGVVVNAYQPGVPGSMTGQSIEVRPDALQPAAPASDLNVSRGFVDRAILTSTVASAFWFSGEGFQPGESVALSGCATSAFTADSNGSVRAPLIVSPATSIYNCVYTGATSGRVAYAHVRAAPEAQDLPSALVSPSNTTASGGGTVFLLLNHLSPGQSGTVYVDNLSGASGNINANGYGSVSVSKPNTPGGHAVFFIGNSGQAAVAPVFLVPTGGTATPTPEVNGTATAIVLTLTALPSSTATPTVRPGGTATATSVPGATSTPTATPVPGATSTATTVPGSTATATLVPGSTATATTVPGSTATATATPCTASFADVPPAYWAYTYIQWAACQGIVSGYADHTFRPDNNTTRGQLAKMVVLAAGFPLVSPPTPHFADVPVAHPFYTYIETAYAHGVISGYADGTFRPGNDVTRGQLSKMVVLSQGIPVSTPATPTFLDVPPADPFYGYIETAVAHNIVSGYTCGSPGEPCPGRYYRPNVSATRAQLSKMLYQATHPAQP